MQYLSFMRTFLSRKEKLSTLYERIDEAMFYYWMNCVPIFCHKGKTHVPISLICLLVITHNSSKKGSDFRLNLETRNVRWGWVINHIYPFYFCFLFSSFPPFTDRVFLIGSHRMHVFVALIFLCNYSFLLNN